jgi:hypothetical protein
MISLVLQAHAARTLRLVLIAASLLLGHKLAAAEARNYYAEYGYKESGSYVRFGSTPDDVCKQYASMWGWDRNGYSAALVQLQAGFWKCQRYYKGSIDETSYAHIYGVCQVNPTPLTELTGRYVYYPSWDKAVGACYCAAPAVFDSSIQWCELPRDLYHLTAPSDSGTGNPEHACGNPVDVISGNKFQQEVDIALPGSPLHFTRVYNSFSAEQGEIGHGWQHNFGARFKIELLPLEDDRRLGLRSGLYATPAAACQSGWAGIAQAFAPGLREGTSAQYVDNQCHIVKAGAVLATVPVAVVKAADAPHANFVYSAQRIVTVTRSNGRSVRFYATAEGWRGRQDRPERLIELYSGGQHSGWRLIDPHGARRSSIWRGGSRRCALAAASGCCLATILPAVSLPARRMGRGGSLALPTTTAAWRASPAPVGALATATMPWAT